MIGHTKALLSPHWRFRSAVTGEFVSKAYALLHPRETVRERMVDPFHYGEAGENLRDEGDSL